MEMEAMRNLVTLDIGMADLCDLEMVLACVVIAYTDFAGEVWVALAL